MEQKTKNDLVIMGFIFLFLILLSIGLLNSKFIRPLNNQTEEENIKQPEFITDKIGDLKEGIIITRNGEVVDLKKNNLESGSSPYFILNNN